MTEREKFEAEYEQKGALPWGYLKKQRTQSGGYSIQMYSYMWDAWQAATASTQEQMAALAAENSALKSAFNPKEIPEDAVEAFTETAIMDHDWDDTGSWSWVENDTDVIRAVLAVMASPETPATDAFIAEQQAIGVEKFADFKNNEMFSLHPDTHAVGAIAATMSAQVKELKSFARQLRDEVKP